MNITARRGDSERYLLTITEDEAAVDLTGASIWMTAKRRARDADADAVFQKTVGDGITVTNAIGGLARVDLVPGDTEDLPARPIQLVYDVQVRLADNRVLTPISGILTVSPDVTVSTA